MFPLLPGLGNGSLPLPSIWWRPSVLAVPALPCVTFISAPPLTRTSPRVSLSSQDSFLFLQGLQLHWIRAHLNDLNLISPSKTLFPNNSTVIGPGVKEFPVSFREHSSAHNTASGGGTGEGDTSLRGKEVRRESSSGMGKECRSVGHSEEWKNWLIALRSGYLGRLGAETPFMRCHTPSDRETTAGALCSTLGHALCVEGDGIYICVCI